MLIKSKFKSLLMAAGASLLFAGNVYSADLSIVSGAVGNDLAVLNDQLVKFKELTGHNVSVTAMPESTTDQFSQYKLWLSAKNSDIDIYRTDVIWAPQLAAHLVDLSDKASSVTGDHFDAIIQSQTVNGKLVALPAFTDAPALYYRKDLLEKHGQKVPTTWDELEQTAKAVLEKEHAAGNTDLQGFVFQGAAYEGLTCDALEWIKSNDGGQIVEPDGTISVNNPNAAEMINKVKGWIGTISPNGVLAYKEEDSRGVWQTGKSVFMRNWPYAYSLGNNDDSKVKGLFDVTTLPIGPSGKRSAATLGGWNLAVSKYSKNVDAAIELVLFLGSAESQKERALRLSKLPTIKSLYDDADIAKEQPIIPRWKNVFLNAVPRPSAPTLRNYNEVSKEFWTAVSNTLSGNGTAETNLKKLESKLKRLKGSGWK